MKALIIISLAISITRLVLQYRKIQKQLLEVQTSNSEFCRLMDAGKDGDVVYWTHNGTSKRLKVLD